MVDGQGGGLGHARGNPRSEPTGQGGETTRSAGTAQRTDRHGAAGKTGRRRLRMRPRRILAAAGRAGRRYWWQILAVSIPVSLVGSGLEIITDHYVDPSDALLSISSSLGSTAITLLGTVLLSGFVTRLVSAAEHGREPLTLPQVARSLPWWRLVGADILVSVLVVIGFVLLIVPGFIALTRLAVTGPVVEIEHRRVFAAIRRSRQLTRRHGPTVLLLATAPLAIAAELEAIAPEPDRVGEIAQFLLIRGLAVGVVEACIAVVLCELCYQLIATQAAQQALDQRRAESRVTGESGAAGT